MTHLFHLSDDVEPSSIFPPSEIAGFFIPMVKSSVGENFIGSESAVCAKAIVAPMNAKIRVIFKNFWGLNLVFM